MRRDHHGFSLVEIVVTLALAGIVVALAGSLFVSSLSLWRGGRDLREAQIEAVGLVDLMARDVRNATKSLVVADGSGLVAEEGEPFLLVSGRAYSSPDEGSAWILYIFLPERGHVLRQLLTGEPGIATPARTSRVVGRGIVRVSAERTDNRIALHVEARRGRATAQSRITAAPRNP